MSDKPKIPYSKYQLRDDAKGRVRKLSEAGKLSGRAVKIPHYGFAAEENEQDVKA